MYKDSISRLLRFKSEEICWKSSASDNPVTEISLNRNKSPKQIYLYGKKFLKTDTELSKKLLIFLNFLRSNSDVRKSL